MSEERSLSSSRPGYKAARQMIAKHWLEEASIRICLALQGCIARRNPSRGMQTKQFTLTSFKLAVETQFGLYPPGHGLMFLHGRKASL